MDGPLSLTRVSANEVFPFHFVLDLDLNIRSCGKVLGRLLPELPGGRFDQHFEWIRPPFFSGKEGITYQALSRFRNTLIQLQSRRRENLVLKGEIAPLADSDGLLFLGSPWIRSLDELGHLGLALADFPPHDPMGTMLMLLQAKATAMDDAHRLAHSLQELHTKLDSHVDERTKALAEAMESLRLSETRHRSVFEVAPYGLLLEEGGRIEEVNQAALSLLGADTLGELLGHNLLSFVLEADWEVVAAVFHDLTSGPPRTVETRIKRLDGRTFDAAITRTLFKRDGNPAVLTALQDISARKRFEDVLTYQAGHDALTDLPNRSLFLSHLRQSIAMARRQEQRLMVAFMDLDRFKAINDTLGHAAGDELLRTVANRLTAGLRESDVAARLGGDEFAVLIHNVGDAQGALLTLQRIVDTIAQPMNLAGAEETVTCSVGCSIFPEDGTDSDALLSSADAAMYRTKEMGRNGIQLYDTRLKSRHEEKSRLESELGRALSHDELRLFFQPQVDLETGFISGAEAFLRWNHPTEGLLPAGSFIGLAEESGLIVPIGEWGFRQICTQLRQWMDEGLPPLRVGVNLSGRQLLRPGMRDRLQSFLDESRVDPGLIELEFTEAASMEDPERTLPLMRQLKDMGLGISMDDFGTGYTNLSDLRRLPLDRLKVDGNLVRGLAGNPEGQAICSAMIHMAHAFHLAAVAEMTETEGEVCVLKAMGCDTAQGYYFSHPMAPEGLAALLRAGPMHVPSRGSQQNHERAVLILDDEPHVTGAMRRTLFREEYQVFTAQHAEEAFELLAQKRIQVVLSDFSMPGMNGVEFLRRVRQMHPQVVRILFSGHHGYDMARAAINRGAVSRILSKPVGDAELKDVLKEAFAQAAMQTPSNLGGGGGRTQVPGPSAIGMT